MALSGADSACAGADSDVVAGSEAMVPPVSAAKSVTISTVITVKHAELWSIPRPFIYTLVTHLEQRDPTNSHTVQFLDSVNTTVGLRTAVFKENDGFHLNGQRVRLKGFCNHNDFDAGTLITSALIWYSGILKVYDDSDVASAR